MKDHTRFKTQNTNRICINLKSEHYLFLKQLSNTKFDGNLSETILYLISKYLKSLYKIKQTANKKTLTITYQPKTKEYIKYNITVNINYWAKVNSLKFYLGYSMSFILRIMIDWEMMEENIQYTPLILKPQLPVDETFTQSLLHSYDLKMRVRFDKRFVIMIFKDQFQ